MGKQVMVGVESFDELIEEDYFYVDKTLLIKELMEKRGKVTLITRPRRFGKTLNMSMLKSFFDMSRDNNHLFSDLKIMAHGNIVEKHMGKYPVIFMTLKDVEENSFDRSVGRIRELVSEVFDSYLFVHESGILNERQRDRFHALYMGKATEPDLKSAMKFLTECLHAYYKKGTVILIDEYDAPINNALIEGYYTEMIKFMRGFLGSAFKGNNYLGFGVLTGVQRVSKEGLVSGFNNPKVCGIVDDEFSDCYGFTEEEVVAACKQYGYGDRFCDVKKWYDGYRFGDRDMYNPWSIAQFLSRGKLQNYWANTGGISVLDDMFSKGSASLKNDIAGLLTDAPIKMAYDAHITYPIEYKNDNAFWSLLLNAGYLKPCAGSSGDTFYAELVNREVKDTFRSRIDLWFRRQQGEIRTTILEFVD